MKRNQSYFYSALLITLAALTLLITGSPVLNWSVDANNQFPLGTIITWAGMIGLPATLYFGIRALRKPTPSFHKILSLLLRIAIVLGILWVPLSYVLAGNFSFSFSNKATFQGGQAAMRWFWRLSYGIPIMTLTILIFYWISLLFIKRR
ncbi:hypothetical protein [Aquimarina brevivitae]|nr:hypothetical protein [Aquimarina brevivitae]